jgi:hypothetical protein
MKNREWSRALSQDTLTWVSALIGIFKGLRLVFSEPLSDEWVRLPNKGSLYGGRRPLDAMVEGGIPKLLEVHRHIDALRGALVHSTDPRAGCTQTTNRIRASSRQHPVRRRPRMNGSPEAARGTISSGEIPARSSAA